MPCLYTRAGMGNLDGGECKPDCKDAVPTLLEQIINWGIDIDKESKEIEDAYTNEKS